MTRWRPRGRVLSAPGLVAVVLVAGVASVVAVYATSRGPQVWAEGSAHGRFVVAFDGHGRVTGDRGSIRVRPQASVTPSETHASLVLSRRSFGDVDLTATIRTNDQLRTGSSPNPWEVGWLVWRYRDGHHFYAVALKPNGWEVSKEDPAYPGAQRFLASGSSPRFSVGSSHRVRVVMRKAQITVLVDGRRLVRVTDEQEPYADGRIGFYSEDADVTFSELRLR